MKIQYLSLEKLAKKGMECNTLGNPMAFDSFDINIIDLSSEKIWWCGDTTLKNSSYLQDFNNLRTIINESKYKRVVFLLPQDLNIKYGYNSFTTGHGYHYSAKLKNVLPYLNNNLKAIGLNFLYAFGFENNRLAINDVIFNSSFYFSHNENVLVLHKALDSDKAVTISKDGIICTFLDLGDEDHLFLFLKDLGLIKRDDIPNWIIAFDAFDDSTLKSGIKQQEVIIDCAKKIIEKNALRLSENNYYKQVLCLNDVDLVERVFKILDEMLGTNLNDSFIDKKREDFIIKNNGITYIGEIKGVSSNVRNEHISQVDNHLSLYEDKLQEEGKIETLKKILIINHQRQDDLTSRKPIHINQIRKAEKDNVLIIETITLLRLFEKYKKGLIDSNGIFKLLEDNVGVLNID